MKTFNRQDAKDAEVGEREKDITGEGEKEGIIREEPSRELDSLASRVIGAAIEVHRHLGPGFLEGVYEGALSVEFRLLGIPFERQKLIAVGYKDVPVGEGRLDFLVADSLIVELKAIEALAPIHKAQVISYLKATHLRLGLLINFNVPILKHGLQRIILS